MRIKLYDWAPSPFSLKLRAILAYKGIAFERVSMLAPSNWWAVRSRGKIGKAPALEIDGRMHVDSTDISYELEAGRRRPPSSPAMRGSAPFAMRWKSGPTSRFTSAGFISSGMMRKAARWFRRRSDAASTGG